MVVLFSVFVFIFGAVCALQLRFISLVHTNFFISYCIEVPVFEVWPNLIGCLQIWTYFAQSILIHIIIP